MGKAIDKSVASNVRFSQPKKPSAAARDLLRLWTSRRHGAEFPARSSFATDDLARWRESLALVASDSSTMHVELYGATLPAAAGVNVAGLSLPNWPEWLQMIGLHTTARLRVDGGPFVERVHRMSFEGPRVYDRIVLPLSDASGRTSFWLTFIDNAHFGDASTKDTPSTGAGCIR